MRRKSRDQLCRQVSRWHEAELIDDDALLLLNQRYDDRGSFLAAMLKWLGLFAVVQLGLAILSFIVTMTESKIVAAVCLGGIGFAAWKIGVTMCTDRLGRHPFTGAALVTTGLAAFFGTLVLLIAGDDAQGLPWLMMLTAAVAGITAYRYHLRWPLLLGLLLFFHGVGFEHAYFGSGGYGSSIHDPKLMAVLGLVTACLGLWHEQALERDRLHRDAGFGRLYLILGLLYFNLSLWFLTVPDGHFGTIMLFAVAAGAQIVAGAGRDDSRLTGFGVVFLAINIYTRLFETMWDHISQGSLFLIAGLLAMVAGYASERKGLLAVFRDRNRAGNAGLCRLVHKELDALLREGVLGNDAHARIGARYPHPPWNWQALGRWFIIFGAVCTGTGAVILGPQIFDLTLTDLAGLLLAFTIGSFWAAHAIRRRHSMPWTTRGIELLGSFSLIGLTFTLGVRYSSGAGNWPLLLLIDLVLLLGLAYLLNNVLLMTLSVVVFFTWFGGFTGYASGWGMYWFGMNYPLRFLLAAVPIALIGLIHLRAEDSGALRFEGFGKLWLSAGLFFGQMALWLLSVFGNFGDAFEDFSVAGPGELFFYNVLWAGASGFLVFAGARSGMRMLHGYGFTFLIIQSYTLFFTHLAESMGLTLSLLVAGGSALYLAFSIERKRRERLLLA